MARVLYAAQVRQTYNNCSVLYCIQILYVLYGTAIHARYTAVPYDNTAI